jgi:hypothetical protein
MHGILDISLCADCRNGHPDKYGCVTKTRAMKEYRLKESDLASLREITLPNPYHKTGKYMYLYLHRQVRQIAKTRYGGEESYIVQHVPLAESQLRWFHEEPERMREMSPGAFQRLVADRVDAMGLDVLMVGDVNRKDGGIDIIATPKAKNLSFPFLLGIQCKHHRVEATTGSSDVRDLHGVITSRGPNFSAGMLVTNTAFSPDALWFARNQGAILRLRDLRDLARWLHDDFDNEEEWREIPGSIMLAPGVEIVIPRPKIFLPDELE